MGERGGTLDCLTTRSSPINLISFSWGHTKPPGAVPVQFDSLTIEKPFDSLSPALAAALTTGQQIKTLVLEVHPTLLDKDPLPSERVTLQDVRITAYEVLVPQGQALSALVKPTEKISFSFFVGSIWEYRIPGTNSYIKKSYSVLTGQTF